ncbi:hypothetical protein Undi14_01495 [Undibacterium sp. 14-3-2]|uniref:hypothetical protein n=1 Tax=Undibacterium sp. 14-3-2 TaxID=2800129 RepID=UPI0019068BE5|nr:hypothetical protein [Undibacterium sp. 14-3-2]MBK1888691.1 hypothetical protein [Undibacterium sp. 14-3-2]
MKTGDQKKKFESANRYQKAAQAVLKRNRKWTCLHSGCTKRSIYSHAISKAIALSTIAEEEYLSTIESRRQYDTKILQFGLISINEATAFNGFCEKHEVLFSDLDNWEITRAKSLLMQAYRSVISRCINESRLAELNGDCDVARAIEDHAVDQPWLLEEDEKNLFLSDLKKSAEVHKRRARALMELPTELLRVRAVIEDRPLNSFGFVTTEKSSHFVTFRRLEFRIPVAVNCFIPMVATDRQLDFYFSVIPYKDSSLVFGVIPKNTDSSLIDILDQRFSSEVGVLDLVESIIACSNEWYMSPSVLDEMPIGKREVFLQDSTFQTEQRIFDIYDMTLFDNLRRTLGEQRPELKAQLRLEKINDIPIREIFEVRHKKMINKIETQCLKLLDL